MDARRLCLGPERLDGPEQAHLAPWVAKPARSRVSPVALSRAAAELRSFCLRVSRRACGSPPNACTFGDRTVGRTAGSLSQYSVSAILLRRQLYHNIAVRTQHAAKTQADRQLTYSPVMVNSLVYAPACLPRTLPEDFTLRSYEVRDSPPYSLVDAGSRHSSCPGFYLWYQYLEQLEPPLAADLYRSYGCAAGAAGRLSTRGTLGQWWVSSSA